MRRHIRPTAALAGVVILGLVVAPAPALGGESDAQPAADPQLRDPEIHVTEEVAVEAVPATRMDTGRLAQEDMPDRFDRARVIPGDSWQIGYQYAYLTRNANRSGTNRESVSRIFEQGYSRTSFSQHVETHTIQVLHAPTERITLGVSLPIVHSDTRFRQTDGSSFTTGNQGVGDLEFSGRLRFMRNGQENLVLHLALQAPTGSIDERSRTPTGRERLPYDQQVGGGTWNFLPGMTYTGQYGGTSWGVQLGAEFTVGENDHGWSRGDVFHTGGWLAQRVFDLVTGSFWLEWREWGDINGRDDHISETWPSGNPNRYGGADLVLGSGLELAIPGLSGQRLAVDASFPVYQSLDGPQLESRWRLQASWEWVF